MANWTIGTAEQFDALPLLPIIDTTNGGIQLDEDIPMGVGASVTFDGLLHNELTYTSWRTILYPRSPSPTIGYGVEIPNGLTTFTTGSYAMTPSTISGQWYELQAVSTRSTALLAYILASNTTNRTRTLSRGITIRNPSNEIVWEWLTKVSDYKTTPPNATIKGTIEWGKFGIEANYLTPALAVSGITDSAPTEPITIYVLDRYTDVSTIPATINGQPVTLSYIYAKGSKPFDFGFNFNF